MTHLVLKNNERIAMINDDDNDDNCDYLQLIIAKSNDDDKNENASKSKLSMFSNLKPLDFWSCCCDFSVKCKDLDRTTIIHWIIIVLLLIVCICSMAALILTITNKPGEAAPAVLIPFGAISAFISHCCCRGLDYWIMYLFVLVISVASIAIGIVILSLVGLQLIVLQIPLSFCFVLFCCWYWECVSTKHKQECKDRIVEIHLARQTEEENDTTNDSDKNDITGDFLMYSMFLLINMLNGLAGVFRMSVDEFGPPIIFVPVYCVIINIFNLYICNKIKSRTLVWFHYIYVCGIIIGMVIKTLRNETDLFYIVIFMVVFEYLLVVASTFYINIHQQNVLSLSNMNSFGSQHNNNNHNHNNKHNSNQVSDIFNAGFVANASILLFVLVPIIMGIILLVAKEKDSDMYIQWIALFVVECITHCILVFITRMKVCKKLYWINILYVETFGWLYDINPYCGYFAVVSVSIFTVIWYSKHVITNKMFDAQVCFVFFIIYCYCTVCAIAVDENKILNAVFTCVTIVLLLIWIVVMELNVKLKKIKYFFSRFDYPIVLFSFQKKSIYVNLKFMFIWVAVCYVSPTAIAFYNVLTPLAMLICRLALKNINSTKTSTVVSISEQAPNHNDVYDEKESKEKDEQLHVSIDKSENDTIIMDENVARIRLLSAILIGYAFCAVFTAIQPAIDSTENRSAYGLELTEPSIAPTVAPTYDYFYHLLKFNAIEYIDFNGSIDSYTNNTNTYTSNDNTSKFFDESQVLSAVWIALGTFIFGTSAGYIRYFTNYHRFLYYLIFIVIATMEVIISTQWLNSKPLILDLETIKIFWIPLFIHPIYFIMCYVAAHASKEEKKNDSDNTKTSNCNNAVGFVRAVHAFIFGMIFVDIALSNVPVSMTQLFINNILVAAFHWKLSKLCQTQNKGKIYPKAYKYTYVVYTAATTIFVIVAFFTAQENVVPTLIAFAINLMPVVPLLCRKIKQFKWIINLLLIQSVFVNRFAGYVLIPILMGAVIVTRAQRKSLNDNYVILDADETKRNDKNNAIDISANKNRQERENICICKCNIPGSAIPVAALIHVLLYLYPNEETPINNWDPFWLCIFLVFTLVSTLMVESTSNNIKDLVMFTTPNNDDTTLTRRIVVFDIVMALSVLIAIFFQADLIACNVNPRKNGISIFYAILTIGMFLYLIVLLASKSSNMPKSNVIACMVIGLIVTQIIEIARTASNQKEHNVDWFYGGVLMVMSIVITYFGLSFGVSDNTSTNVTHVIAIIAITCIQGFAICRNALITTRENSANNHGLVIALVINSLIVELMTVVYKFKYLKVMNKMLAITNQRLQRQNDEQHEQQHQQRLPEWKLILLKIKALYFNIHGLCSILQVLLILVPYRMILIGNDHGNGASIIFLIIIVCKLIVLIHPNRKYFQDIHGASIMWVIGYPIVFLDGLYGIFLLFYTSLPHFSFLRLTFILKQSTLSLTLSIVLFYFVYLVAFFGLNFSMVQHSPNVFICFYVLFGLGLYSFVLFLFHWTCVRINSSKQHAQFDYRVWILMLGIIMNTVAIFVFDSNNDTTLTGISIGSLAVMELLAAIYCLYYLLRVLDKINTETLIKKNGAFATEPSKTFKKYVHQTKKISYVFITSLIFVTVPVYLQLNEFVGGDDGGFNVVQFFAVVLFGAGIIIYGIIISYNTSPLMFKGHLVLFIIIKICSVLCFYITRGVSVFLTLFIVKTILGRIFGKRKQSRRAFYAVYIAGCAVLAWTCHFDAYIENNGSKGASDGSSFIGVNLYTFIVWRMDVFYFEMKGKKGARRSDDTSKEADFYWWLRLVLGLVSCLSAEHATRRLELLMIWSYVVGTILNIIEFWTSHNQDRNVSIVGLVFIGIGLILVSFNDDWDDNPILKAVRFILMFYGVVFLFIGLGLRIRFNYRKTD